MNLVLDQTLVIELIEDVVSHIDTSKKNPTLSHFQVAVSFSVATLGVRVRGALKG